MQAQALVRERERVEEWDWVRVQGWERVLAMDRDSGRVRERVLDWEFVALERGKSSSLIMPDLDSTKVEGNPQPYITPNSYVSLQSTIDTLNQTRATTSELLADNCIFKQRVAIALHIRYLAKGERVKNGLIRKNLLSQNLLSFRIEKLAW